MTIHRGRTYLEKHRYSPRYIFNPPRADLGMVLTIPCHNEPDVVKTLDSLEICQKPPCEVEVLVIVNASEDHPQAILQQNDHSIRQISHWIEASSKKFTYHLLNFPALPQKHAGVGLARKIAMDEAVDRLEQVEYPRGIIIGLDADTLVAPNYLKEIWNHFQQHPKSEAASIYFEHPTQGKEYITRIYQGIIRYELFLRYYIEALRYAGYPFAYHTIGSAMAVRSEAYQRQGGMNRRKAGEDFYFLQKFIAQGTLSEIHSTCVYPSPRPSQKVPFGTGRAISEWMEKDTLSYPAYNLQTFEDLKHFCANISSLYTSDSYVMPDSLRSFFETEGFQEKLAEIRHHVSTEVSFVKRFYQYFDALKVLKYVHFSRDHFYPNEDIYPVAVKLGDKVFSQLPKNTPLLNLLGMYRRFQRREESYQT
ncbi:MAG: glycosyltransferase [Bacteroidota bacterium]